MNAKVIVMPKAAVLDPQGNAVRDAMRHLGMPEVRSVRIGKYMEIEIEGQNGELESRLHQLCRDLLSNPVIEDYELQQTDVGRQKSEVRDQKKTPNPKVFASNAPNVERPTLNIQRARRRGPPFARLRRGKRGRLCNESATIFFLRGISATCSVDDRADREFLSKHHFDVARLDTGRHPCVSRRERLPRGATRSRTRALDGACSRLTASPFCIGRGLR